MKSQITNHKSPVMRVLSTVTIITLLMAIVLTGAAFAAGSTGNQADHPPRFIDEPGLLSSTEASALTGKLDEISERRKFDTVVVVINSLGGKNPRLYAADFYEQSGYGYGGALDGIILLIAMERRDFAFVTTGYGFYAFTDAGQEYLESLFLPHLSKGDYSKAFMTFANAVDDFLSKAETGRPYDRGNIPRPAARVWAVIISLVLAALIAVIVTGIWRIQLKSVRRQDHARNYILEGSMALTVQRDVFLHRHVTKTKRQKSGSGGSSGSFSSSSGRSFSGRSGKF